MRGEGGRARRVIYPLGGQGNELRPDAVHAFHTRPLLGSIPIIIQKQLQDRRIHKSNGAGLKQP